MKSENKKLAIVLAYSVNIRDLINSGFLKYLLEMNRNYELTIYTQKIDIKKQLNFKSRVLPLQEYKNSFIEKIFKRFYILSQRKHMKVINQNIKKTTKFKKLFYKLFIFFNNFVSDYKIRDLSLAVLRYTFFIKNLFNKSKYFKENYDLIIFSRSLIGSFDYGYSMEAQLFKYKTILLAGSWDNFTTKGFIDFKYDKIGVWNKKMKQELINIYKIKDERIFLTGYPRYKSLISESKNKRNDINHDFKILVCLSYSELTKYKGSNLPSEVENIISLIKKIDKEIKNDKQVISIIIRFHPLTNIEIDFLQEIKVSSSNLIIECYMPGLKSEYVESLMNKEDENIYKDQLNNADLIISSASTVSIDAMCLQKPQINICWDPPKAEFYEPTTRLWKFNHLEDLVSLTNLKLCKSEDEAIEIISNCMNNNYIDNVNYYKFKEYYVPNTDQNYYCSSVVNELRDI